MTEAGMDQHQYNGRSGSNAAVAPGTYSVRMDADRHSAARKVVMLRYLRLNCGVDLIV